MKKSVLERFIKKYRLNGLIESAMWVVNNGSLNVSAVNCGNQVFARVTYKNFGNCGDAKIGVSDPEKVLALLKTLPSEDISCDTIKYASGDVAVVVFSDGVRRAEYVAANPKNMGTIPTLNRIPPWNAAIILDDEFKQWFLKAYRAIEDQMTPFTVLNSERTGNLEVVFGYTENDNSDTMHFRADTADNMDAVTAPIGFPAQCLREVLRANPEVKNPILNVSDDGLASITFSEGDLDSEYYLAKSDAKE